MVIESILIQLELFFTLWWNCGSLASLQFNTKFCLIQIENGGRLAVCLLKTASYQAFDVYVLFTCHANHIH